MMLTWTPNPVPYDQAFEAIKSAIDALPAGMKLFTNGGTVTVYVISQNHHSFIFQANSTAKTSRQLIWPCSLHSTRRTPDMRIRSSCLSKGV